MYLHRYKFFSVCIDVGWSFLEAAQLTQNHEAITKLVLGCISGAHNKMYLYNLDAYAEEGQEKHSYS